MAVELLTIISLAAAVDPARGVELLPGSTWKSLPFSLLNAALGVLIVLSGNRLSVWHGITARK
jgi:hypothetical protein